MSLQRTTRLTSKDIRIEYIPCGLADAAHDEDIDFHADVTGGTFKIRVNGELTAAITYVDTDATFETNVQTALDNLPLTGITFNVTVTGDECNITVTENIFIRITIEDNQLTGNATADDDFTQTINTQGTTTYVISNEVTQFSYERSVDTVDMTAISEYTGTDVPVKSTMSFDMTVFDANEVFTGFIIEEGQNGLFTVYKEGKIVGNEVFAFVGLIESFGKDFPDHEKLEISLSGMRQGKMEIPFGSVYRG